MRDADFEALYAREAQGLYGFLAYRTGDRALAEDLLADTFERALRFGAELTVPEIAKLLGERLTTVEGRVYRALRKLRERL